MKVFFVFLWAGISSLAWADTHSLNLRNISGYPVEYTLSRGPVNTSTSWVGIPNGGTRSMYVSDGQYLYCRFSGSQDMGRGMEIRPHPHRQWWWRVGPQLEIVGDPEMVPPGYSGN